MREKGDFPRADHVQADEDRPTLGELFTRVGVEASAFMRAEIALYRAEATHKIISAGGVIALFLAAFVLAFGAVIALLVGLVIALAKPIGVWWALAVVVFGALALAALLGWIGSRQAARLTSGPSS